MEPPVTTWTDDQLASIHNMLNPRSIAVIGASPRLAYGGRMLAAALKAADRVNVYPVNPRYEEIQGVKSYPSVSDLPETPDVVGVVVSSGQVLDVLKEAHQKGTRAAIIISAGFSERGDQDRAQLQGEIGKFARRSQVRVCGPNCLGVANLRSGIWATASNPDPNVTYGPIALVSQSGATAFGPLMTRAVEMGMGYSHIVSTGNEADLESSDFIRYFLEDPDIRVVACFIEGFKDGLRFLEVARLALEQGKRIALIKVGRSGVGAQAALSHTAALTGSDAIHDAAFKQFGVIRADDYDDLLQKVHLLAYSPPPAREGILVVSHSGGVSSLIADCLGQEELLLPTLTEGAAEDLNGVLKGLGWASNPADVTGYANGDDLGKILRILDAEPQAGALVIATAGRTAQTEQVVELAKDSTKALAFLTTGGEGVEPGLAQLRSAHVPLFYSPQSLAQGLRGFFDYHRRRNRWVKQEGQPSRPSRPRVLLQPPLPSGPHTLSEHDAKKLLAHWGVPATRELRAHSPEEALNAAQDIGFPVALKLDSPHILHKTEAGVVKLGINNGRDLKRAYREVVANGLKYCPETKGSPVLVQEIVSEGTEVIVGLTQDSTFGPVLLFGLGGVFVEVLEDVAMRICPITQADAREMVEQVKGARLLEGARGRSPADVDALREVLLGVSDLARDLAHRKPEVDINPLMVLDKGRGVKALDALVTFGQ